MSNKFSLNVIAIPLITFSALALSYTSSYAIEGVESPILANSAQNENTASAADLSGLLKALDEKDKEIADHETRLDQQKQEIEQLKNLVKQLIAQQQNQMKQVATSEATGANSTAKSASAESSTPQKTVSTEDVKHVGLERRQLPKKQPPQIAAVPNEGGVLLAPGKAVIEPSVDYSRSSALRVAIEGFTIIPALSIGSFEISQADRDTLTNSLAFRMGIFKRFELATRIPYVFREDSTLSRPIGTGSSSSLLNNVTGDGIGDVELSGHYQINDGKDGWPFFIGNFRFKSATGQDPFSVAVDPTTGLPLELSTGSGFYAYQPSVTAIYPTDPAVLYSTLGYTLNQARNVGGTYGEIDPGDSINYSVGMGFAINDDTSFSLAYSHDIVMETLQNGSTIPTSDVLQIAQFTTGLSHKVTDRVNINFNLSAGLTDDAPDMRVGIKVPVKFTLW